MIYNEQTIVDPLGDSDQLEEQQAKKNYAKVGSARPSSLLYTYGPGSIIDLPHFTIMPTGLESWDRIWQFRRDGQPPSIDAPRLLEVVQLLLGHSVKELRPFPWQPTTNTFSKEGSDLGLPARVFPQWMRCTGCDRLATIYAFKEGYRNTHPYRPDEAVFMHLNCPGRGRTDRRQDARQGKKKTRPRPTVPARYLIACPNGHLDEFPYDWWVHRGEPCPKARNPILKMEERGGGRGANAIIVCASCGQRRTMAEAQGAQGRTKLPGCRGRFPHLDAFERNGCDQEPRLMLVGASNLWFPALQSIIDMPRDNPEEKLRDDAQRLMAILGNKLEKYASSLEMIRDLLDGKGSGLDELDDNQLQSRVQLALSPVDQAEQDKKRAVWEPVDLLVPEWRYLQREPAREFDQEPRSQLTLSPRPVSPFMPKGVSRVLAVNRLRKVNAVIGFTRIDDLDRANDRTSRLVPLVRSGAPQWVPATEDRGEGIFLQLDLDVVEQWEQTVQASSLWEAHREAHHRNFERRFSETAKIVDPDLRLPSPRYWLVHTLAHGVIRQLAMSSGYGAASLTERIYAWPKDAARDRPAAAGVLICTTASDSDGTLGGLVALSESERLAEIVNATLTAMRRCSSDPVCAMRVPKDPEDFLHGAACHCCVMASETSCEGANRFLDRRFVVPLPGQYAELAFFKD
ncbi:MAG: hypothetical protein LBL92_06125 [Propionibacteriaceae bacterium]|jgi:hypothetical protein|nr:hypothetical protein [Propionibacteriaceae bacterium]